jgi:hypothetical protein
MLPIQGIGLGGQRLGQNPLWPVRKVDGRLELTRQQLLDEIDEKSKDLDVFSRARDDIRRRVLEVSDSKCLLTPLPNWSGTDAVLGSLDLVCNAIERTVAELQHELKKLPPEPTLRIVRTEDVAED